MFALCFHFIPSVLLAFFSVQYPSLQNSFSNVKKQELRATCQVVYVLLPITTNMRCVCFLKKSQEHVKIQRHHLLLLNKQKKNIWIKIL